MVDELARPGVQHGHDADGAGRVSLVARQLGDRLGRRAHQSSVAVLLVGAQHIAQLRRHRHGDVEIRTRQKLRLATVPTRVDRSTALPPLVGRTSKRKNYAE
jgi:hypothetical protein